MVMCMCSTEEIEGMTTNSRVLRHTITFMTILVMIGAASENISFRTFYHSFCLQSFEPLHCGRRVTSVDSICALNGNLQDVHKIGVGLHRNFTIFFYLCYYFSPDRMMALSKERKNGVRYIETLEN